MKRLLKTERVPVQLWTDDVDEGSLDQLRSTAALPFVFHHVAAMPDVHRGIGATVGSVIATKGAICPAAVGVDIGCGMMAAVTSIPASALEGKLPALRHSIERGVPVGFAAHRRPLEGALAWMREAGRPGVASGGELQKSAHQLGTLGGGNHFIEICVEQDAADPRIVVLLHSGSRGIGNQTARKHIDRARGVMKRLFVDLPDPDLAYFAEGTEDFDAYVEDLRWCQGYAAKNRSLMMEVVLEQLSRAVQGGEPIEPDELVNCHHDYVAWENHYGEDVLVTRKGAIRAGRGELGIIPGSMGAASYIVRGLGNPEAFESAPHGAGRRLSRTRAREEFTVEDLAAQTSGVECRKDRGVLDEIPGAYKPIDEVIANSADLVEVVRKVKQVLCVKG